MKFDREVYNCIYNQNLMGKKSSVHFGNDFRFERAKEQLDLFCELNQDGLIMRESIINLTNEFLLKMGMSSITEPKVNWNNVESNTQFYKKIKKEYGLLSISDIVWMKFTTEGILGAVAVSNDINFEIPKDNNYDEKIKGYWKYNSSGIIIKELELNWNSNEILVFPLINIPEGLNRGDIECGIGNYLINNGIPILDYYSHKF